MCYCSDTTRLDALLQRLESKRREDTQWLKQEGTDALLEGRGLG